MWHIFALPPLARILELLGIVCVAILGWLKRRAIATAGGALRSTASERFWGYFRKKLQTDTKPAAPAMFTEKTYTGIFHGCSQYANYPHETCFELEQDGMITKVPIFKTNMLTGVQHGQFVEIDTRAPASLRAEIVLRVRHKRQ